MVSGAALIPAYTVTDQVLETRAELDSLEEIAQCPLVAARTDALDAFFTAAPQLLHSSASAAAFAVQLVDLLFPELPQLGVWAAAALRCGDGALQNPPPLL